MTLTKQKVRSIVDLYIQAWVGQDPDLIITIFTDTATYHERVLEAPIQDREGIRAYWQTKVVESQDNIDCELLNLYLDGNTAIVEWEAQFDDVVQKVRKRMREVAILVFEDQLIASLREYWASERMDRRLPGPAPTTDGYRGVRAGYSPDLASVDGPHDHAIPTPDRPMS
ncbi:MAG: nuclear transport factor 2 family protein [Pseudonocardiaceae bacterium]